MGVDTEIPLYVSEILMACLIVYMLVTTSIVGDKEPLEKPKKKKSKTQNFEESDS